MFHSIKSVLSVISVNSSKQNLFFNYFPEPQTPFVGSPFIGSHKLVCPIQSKRKISPQGLLDRPYRSQIDLIRRDMTLETFPSAIIAVYEVISRETC